ncbi:MAG: hypothetical protein LZF61_01515 [Nitrosomonas sp.]|nr:MAG: hypothetical protein LZF61_01515 [Nitrosomonas sp.]
MITSVKTPTFIRNILLVLSCIFAINSIGASETSCHPTTGSPQSCLIELPQQAIQQLKIDAGFGWGIFSGTIFNGNYNFHIKQLVISMTPVHDHHHMHMHTQMSHEPKIHRIDLDLPPISKGALSMALPNDVVDAHDFKWEILQVTGYQTQ